MKQKYKHIYYIVIFTVLLITEILIALFIHDKFIRPYFGDVLVVILIYCFIRIFITDKVRLLPLYVYIFAVLVEISQYFHLVSLLGLSDNKLAAVILGTGFDWKDILCYASGSLICTIVYSFRNLLTKNIMQTHSF